MHRLYISLFPRSRRKFCTEFFYVRENLRFLFGADVGSGELRYPGGRRRNQVTWYEIQIAQVQVAEGWRRRGEAQVGILLGLTRAQQEEAEEVDHRVVMPARIRIHRGQTLMFFQASQLAFPESSRNCGLHFSSYFVTCGRRERVKKSSAWKMMQVFSLPQNCTPCESYKSQLRHAPRWVWEGGV